MLTLSLDSVSLPSLPPHSSSHLGLQLSTMNPSVSSHYNATPRGRARPEEWVTGTASSVKTVRPQLCHLIAMEP